VERSGLCAERCRRDTERVAGRGIEIDTGIDRAYSYLHRETELIYRERY